MKEPKKERAASIPARATEIETLGEMKLKICEERQREGEQGRIRGVMATYHHTAEGDID